MPPQGSDENGRYMFTSMCGTLRYSKYCVASCDILDTEVTGDAATWID